MFNTVSAITGCISKANTASLSNIFHAGVVISWKSKYARVGGTQHAIAFVFFLNTP